MPELRETKFNNWAKLESFTIAKQKVYLNGKLSGSTDKNNGKLLPQNYAASAKPIAERQMSLAGYRLADVLAEAEQLRNKRYTISFVLHLHDVGGF